MTVNHLVAGSSPAEAAKVYGGEESMVIQRTVNPPPLACLVRSQDAPPVCCIKCNDGLRILGRQQRSLPSRLHNELHFFKGEYHEKEKNSSTSKLPCQIGIVSVSYTHLTLPTNREV